MTIRQLYKWAIENEVEDANVVFRALYGAGEITFNITNPTFKRKSVDSDGNVTVEIYTISI